MERYLKRDGFIYDAEEQLDLGIEETTDLLNYLCKKIKQLREKNKEMEQKIDEQDRMIEGYEHHIFVGYDLY